jgi:4-carboxymuconolactone decarboxylase
MKNVVVICLTAAALVGFTHALGAQERLGSITPERMTELRNHVAAELTKARPEGALGEKLTHFVVLIAARHWTQQVLWSLHEQPAVEAGLNPEVLAALASGRRPPNLSEDEDILYDFSTELLQTHGVSDATYARMVGQFGEGGVAEATLLHGESTVRSMFMNVARTPLEAGAPALKPFPR